MTAIAQLLQSLGQTADEVAKNLKAEGIQGVRNTARFLNPLVRFVQAKLGNAIVGADIIKLEELTVEYADGRTETTPLPPAVRAFRAAFDRGDYPDLIAP